MSNKESSDPLGIVMPVMAKKGGVGKTTCVFQIGHELSERHGYKVLLIDNDKQGHQAVGFYGIDRADHPEHFLPPPDEDSPQGHEGVSCTFNLYSEYTEGELKAFPARANEEKKSLYLLSGDTRISKIEQAEVADMINNFYHHVSDLREHFDFILIDNGPSFGSPFIASAACAGFGGLLLPFQPEVSSIDGVISIRNQVATIEERLGIEIPILGAVMNQYELQRLSIQSMVPVAEKELGDLLLNTRLKQTDHYKQAYANRDWVGYMWRGKRATATNLLRDLTNEILCKVLQHEP